MKPQAITCSRRPLVRLASVIAVTLLLCGVPTGCTESADQTQSSTTASVAAPDTAEYQVVQFETDDGLTLSGRLYGESDRAVILSHMYPADQTSWQSIAERLASEGYLVLTYDFRGYGLSQGDKDIQYLDRDVDAAIRYLRGAGASEIVLVGASMGGTASLIAAAEAQAMSSVRLAGVATLSAPVEFQGLSAREAVASIRVALLLVAAEDDVGADEARDLQTLSGDFGDLHILPGGDHGTDLFLGAQGDATWDLLLDFVRLCMPVGG